MQMWAFAHYDLHLSDDEFYSITPRQFEALVRRHRHKVESTEVLFAQLTSWVANTGFRSTDKPTQAKDFMPSQWAREPKASSTSKSGRMTKRLRTEVANSLRTLFPPR